MQIKQTLKQYFKSIMIVSAILILIREINDDRPLKFENFGNRKAFEAHIKDRFPIGSEVDKAIEVLVSSGVHGIRIRDIEHDISYTRTNPSAKHIIYFDYNASFISLSPDMNYIVSIKIDKDRKILEVSGSRYSPFKY